MHIYTLQKNRMQFTMGLSKIINAKLISLIIWLILSKEDCCTSKYIYDWLPYALTAGKTRISKRTVN